MRQRAFVHVAGPAGAGKTTFIEALLRGLDELVICVRATRDDKLRSPKESRSKGVEELRRYREAGASDVAAYRFPEGSTASDSFFMSAVMQDYSTAVLVEGDCPVEFVDLEVFVAPPLDSGQSLLRHVERDQAAAHGAAGRARADHLLQEVNRLRKDPAVYKDVYGWRGSKVPITAVAANIADPKDSGLKKAIARVRRAVRSAR